MISIKKFIFLFFMCIPFMWICFFTLYPLFLILKISFSEYLGTAQLYGSILSIHSGQIVLNIDFRNYIGFFDEVILQACKNSLLIASINASLCLFLGYFLAYSIATMPRKIHLPLLILITIPSLIPSLIRIVAWIGFCDYIHWNHYFTSFLSQKQSDCFSMYICLIYSYLWYVAVPLCIALGRIDKSLLEAAYDLGCGPARTFLKIMLPISFDVALNGAGFVFISTLGEFLILQLVAKNNIHTIGSVMWSEFFRSRNWPLACAICITMILFILSPWILKQCFKKDEKN